MSCGGGISSSSGLTFFEEAFGQQNDIRIIYYSNEGRRTFVFPLLKNDEIANLLLVSEDDNFYILEQTDRLGYGDVANTNISPYTARIFDAGAYLSTNIDLSNVRSNLGADYEIGREGNTLILKEKTAHAGRLSATTTGKLASLCDRGVLSLMTSQYLVLLGFDDTYFDIVHEAIVDSQPDGACWCPNPQLILEYLGLAGQDFFYDEAYWASNPTFPQQELPSYDDFFTHFPKHEDGRWLYGPDTIYNLIGGEVLQVRIDYPGDQTKNVCALKVSMALNGANIDIPNIPNAAGLPGTVSGADGKYYFLNARALSEWMKKTFPVYDDYIPAEYTNTNGVHTLLNGRTGIIISVYGGSGTSGHADIYDGTTCSNSPNNPSAACAIVGTVHFWELN